MAGAVGAAGPSAPSRPAAPALPPLREELDIERGPTLAGGVPSWTLYDPASNRFYRLGWQEFEILCRWHLRHPEEIARRIRDETTLGTRPEDVERFAGFLAASELVRGGSPEATARLLGRKRAMRHGWFTTLLHNYLFIRIPLVRPDAALERLTRSLDFLYSPAFLILTLAAGACGLYLVLRQWDSFSAALPWFFSLEGAALAGAALLVSKLLHELGHGLTARRYGCRVPTMGVALLVMAPVLYTDTSAAWRLPQRRKRLAIGIAGIAAECALACYALLAWSFLPDGPLRSVTFIWATTTWVLTLAINLSPFMRFDGYYLLADLLDIPNLQDRSFALARHRLRETLFSFGDKPPEDFAPRTRRILLLYAFATWLYRIVLFTGIALLVYHMFFKLLGVFLFAVEVWWFILRPIWREVREWMKRSRSHRLNRRTALTFLVLGLLLLALFIPWRTSIHAPALLAAQSRVKLFTQLPGQVVRIVAKVGDPITAGAVVMELASPEIAYKAAQAERQVESLRAQIAAASQEPDAQARAQVLAQQLEGARSERAAVQAEQMRLTIRAPLTGRVVDLAEPLAPGEWVKANEQVAVVADLSGSRIDAYVEESDLDRLVAGAAATFVPANVAAARVPARLTGIDRTATRALIDPELASVHGGAIAVRQVPTAGEEQLVPEVPVYRVILTPTMPVEAPQTRVGTVVISGAPASIAGQVWRRVVSVLIRESGF